MNLNGLTYSEIFNRVAEEKKYIEGIRKTAQTRHTVHNFKKCFTINSIYGRINLNREKEEVLWPQAMSSA
jgi:hypothetical protein